MWGVASINSSTGQGGNITLTAGQSTGGSVTITSGSGVSAGSSGGGITLTGGQPGSIQVGTAKSSSGYSHGITPTDSGQWGPVVTEMHMDQLRLEMFDLQQTVKLLMRQNQRLSDEVEALKAGVILDDPVLA